MDLGFAEKMGIFLGLVLIILIGAISSSGFAVYGPGGEENSMYSRQSGVLLVRLVVNLRMQEGLVWTL